MATDDTVTQVICPGHARGVVGIQFSRKTDDGLFLISACHDKLPMLRDGETGDWIGTFAGHDGAVWDAHLNNDATMAVTAAADFTVRLWNAVTGAEVHKWSVAHIAKAAAFNNAGTHVLASDRKKMIYRFSVEQPEEAPLKREMESVPTKLVVLPGDEHCVVGTEAGKLHVLDAASLEPVRELDLRGAVVDVSLSGNGQILTVAAGSTVHFIRVSDWQTLAAHTVELPELASAALHSSGKVFAVGGADNRSYLHSYASGQSVYSFRGHHGKLHCLRFSPNGSQLASGADDSTLRLWQVPQEVVDAETQSAFG